MWNPLHQYMKISQAHCPIQKILLAHNTAQKMKFSIKNFCSKCDQICRKPRIWSHLPNKSLMEKFIFCEVQIETHNFKDQPKFNNQITLVKSVML